MIAMAMNSFGLTPEEREATVIPDRLSFDALEVPTDLDARSRRDVLKGAWQLALFEEIDPLKDVIVRGIAGALQVSAEYDHVRAEVQSEAHKQWEMAEVAVALVRAVCKRFELANIDSWLEHLIDAAVPPQQREEIRHGAAEFVPEALPKLDSDRRRQAMALAAATLVGSDPATSSATALRAALLSFAEQAGTANVSDEAFELLDGWLLAGARDYAQHLLELHRDERATPTDTDSNNKDSGTNVP
jgi:hypothetical protein